MPLVVASCLSHARRLWKPTLHLPSYAFVQIMKKSEVIRLKQTEHVANERSLLQKINHPFIVIT